MIPAQPLAPSCSHSITLFPGVHVAQREGVLLSGMTRHRPQQLVSYLLHKEQGCSCRPLPPSPD